VGRSSIFEIGLEVLIVPLGGRRGTVTAKLRGDRYRVVLSGGAQLTVKESEIVLAPLDDSNQVKEVSEPKSRVKNGEIIRSSKRNPPAAVDLHGLCVADACRKLEEWLNQMILARMWHGKVIHGHGTGKLQLATHEVLGRYQAVSAFKINQFNRGETDVYFS
jgi:dsDNA-specific endonuclease/ATPase MutS2